MDMYMDMRIDMCRDMNIVMGSGDHGQCLVEDMCIGMCTDMCTDMCTYICIDMHIVMFMDMCIDMGVRGSWPAPNVWTCV